MANHPNRNTNGSGSNPTSYEIRSERENVGLTQTEAAHVVYSTCRAWQQWEAGDRRMHPGLWELFQIKTREQTRTHTKLNTL